MKYIPSNLEKRIGKEYNNKMKTNPIEKALEKKHPIQTSKEYVNGKWQKVDFFEGKKGRIKVKPHK